MERIVLFSMLKVPDDSSRKKALPHKNLRIQLVIKSCAATRKYTTTSTITASANTGFRDSLLAFRIANFPPGPNPDPGAEHGSAS